MRSIEDTRFDTRQRELAAITAELLAAWVANSADKQRLNRLVWTASFWLPEEAVITTNKLVCHDRIDPRTVRDVIIEVRKYLKGPGDRLEAKDVAIFE